MPYLPLILSALQVLDGLLTYKILQRGGLELNPLLAKAMDMFGQVPTLIVSKAAVIFLVLWKGHEVNQYLLAALTLMYVIVVGWNLHVYRRLNT